MTMIYRRVHFIEDGADWIAYYCDSMEYRLLLPGEKHCMDSILRGVTEADFYTGNEQKDRTLYRRCREELIDYGTNAEELPEEGLQLNLNTANACNMNCGYCYANGGVYHSREQLMSMEVAQRALDLFADHYGAINRIKFIGGEPLLNQNVVCSVCDYVRKKVDRGEMPAMPEFSIVTNGTILNDRLIQYSKEYHWHVGVSFDGPAEIHDKVRPWQNGRGTSKIIQDNIREWREATGEKCPSSINACYSGVHESSGVTVVEAVAYMKDILGIEKVNIVPVDPCRDTGYALEDDAGCFLSAMEEIFDETSRDYKKYCFVKLNNLEKVLRQHLSMRHHICEAGLHTFGISASGVISPCHMLTDKEGIRMGSVFDLDPWNSEAFRKVQDRLTRFDRFSCEPCSQCYANRLCFGCLGANLFRTGNPYVTDPSICRMIRGALDILVRDIVHQNYRKLGGYAD